MNRRNDDKDTGSENSSDEVSEQVEPDSKEGSSADDTEEDETKRFERSDNLRRRSEWFQKRTGGR